MIEPIRQTTIIPNENKIKTGPYIRKLKKEEAHGLAIVEFSTQNNLNITYQSLGLDKLDYHDIRWFYEMTKKSHLVVQQEEFYILYLPPVLTKNQYAFLLNQKEIIKSFGHYFHIHSIFYEDDTFYRDNIDELLHEYEGDFTSVLYSYFRKKYLPSNDSIFSLIEEDGTIHQQEYDYLDKSKKEVYQKVLTETNILEKNIENKSSIFIEEPNKIILSIPEIVSPNQYAFFLNQKEKLLTKSFFEIVNRDQVERKKETFIFDHENKRDEWISNIYKELEAKTIKHRK